MERSVGRSPKTLKRGFYARPAEIVAQELLGKLLCHGDLRGRITETEAYPGGDDLASHSAAGITERTKVIFGPPGHAYVYLIYGLHYCLNVVTQPEGTPGCVLIRGLEWVSGPARLTRAMGITLEHYGVDFTQGPLTIRDAPSITAFDVTPRIGLTKCADRLLRYVARDPAASPAVQKTRRRAVR